MAALQLAIVFSASVIIAKLSGLIKFLPKVTAYLLVGLALSQASLLNSQAVSSMTALREVALSLMLFLVGAEFRLESLAQGLRHSFQMSKWDVGLTFLAVAALT
ncbi:MAG: cation:proton antiporter, partial [Planctomycetes bacterium]|nr:cation:proton antiporter [Planctomycetota bacterium]